MTHEHGTNAELGQFRVDLRVAPSLPMSFVTVRLIQTGDGGVTMETYLRWLIPLWKLPPSTRSRRSISLWRSMCPM